MAVVKLASANTHVNRTYGISVALSVMVLDLGLIATSYLKILQAVFRLTSQHARSKTLAPVLPMCALSLSPTHLHSLAF